MKFITKPVIKEAIRFENELASVNEMCGAWPEFKNHAEWRQLPELLVLKIKTLEGDHVANKGDWIIKGLKGEFYPCKPDIFEKSYEPFFDGNVKKLPQWYSGEETKELMDWVDQLTLEQVKNLKTAFEAV